MARSFLLKSLMGIMAVFPLLFINCSTRFATIVCNQDANDKDNLDIREGLVSQKAQQIKYKYHGKSCGVAYLTAPVMVAQAEQDEEWGFFQFPNISTTDDGTLIVTWQMKADSHKTYGKNADRFVEPMMSKDGGITWVPREKGYFTYRKGYDVNLDNGDILRIYTHQSKDINGYNHFPRAVVKKGSHSFYLMDSLPNDLQGIYLNRVMANHKSERIHAKLNDPGVLRYAIGNLMPIVWWGDVKILADHSLVAGIYPGYYLDSLGHVMSSGVSFYRSEDEGQSWTILGKIPFQPDGIADKRGDSRFDEPTFEVLADSTFLCVMRTGMTSPMYRSFSTDRGQTWSRPEPFTPNGVLPKLLLLKNGVLVLVSGRPGIQVRFSFDGKGRIWSTPIDMIPFMHKDGTFTRDVSCGYPSIIETGDDTFYIVYSDFTTKDAYGKARKSIWCRKVTVNNL